MFCLWESVTTVDTELSTSHIAGSLGEEVDGSAGEILGLTHATLGNLGSPGLVEVRTGSNDLAGHGSDHVARGDAVNTDLLGSPLDSEGSSHVADGSLGDVVRSLGLRNVDDSTGHGTDENDGALGIVGHSVLSNSLGPEVGASDVDIEDSLEAVMRIVLSGDVLRETSGGDELVDLAVGGNDSCNALVHGLGLGNIASVGSDQGNAGMQQLATSFAARKTIAQESKPTESHWGSPSCTAQSKP